MTESRAHEELVHKLDALTRGQADLNAELTDYIRRSEPVVKWFENLTYLRSMIMSLSGVLVAASAIVGVIWGVIKFLSK